MGLSGGHPPKVLECMRLRAGKQLNSQFCPLPVGGEDPASSLGLFSERS